MYSVYGSYLRYQTIILVLHPDLAVGAPLEGLAGAIYVFLGSPLGVASRPAQVIRGSEYGTLNMRMFGSALSGTLDMDGNGYPGKG